MIETLTGFVQNTYHEANFPLADSRVPIEINFGKWQSSHAFHIKAHVDPKVYVEAVRAHNGSATLDPLAQARTDRKHFVALNGTDVIASFCGFEVAVSEPFLVLHMDGLLLEKAQTLKEILIAAQEEFLPSCGGFAVSIQLDLASLEKGFNVVFVLDIEDYISLVRSRLPKSLSQDRAHELIKLHKYKKKEKVYNRKGPSQGKKEKEKEKKKFAR